VERKRLLNSDFPDPDIIRVDETYYMASTTMHYMPGCVILRSYDLVNWEMINYVYDSLEDNEAHNLTGSKNVYGQGMWAPSLRYHNNTFYICFTANDTKKTYLFRTDDILGDWKKSTIDGFYHDNSLLFDDDRVFIVYGNRQIYITELNESLTGPKEGGLNRMIIEDKGNIRLGYEGSHIYKIHGKYYVFLIHWPADGTSRRTQACYVADDLTGEFVGGDIFDDDIGYHNRGVAQGGIVDTPEGTWYAILFQDSGAIGRIPVLVPVEWKDSFPVFGENKKMPLTMRYPKVLKEHNYDPVVASDSFMYEPNKEGKIQLKLQWQWNHNPDGELWSVTREKGKLWIKTGKCVNNVTQAVNCLTQRMMFPKSEIEVTVDGRDIHDGDYTGIVAFQGRYSFAGVTKEAGKYYLVMGSKTTPTSPMGKVIDEDEAYIHEKVAIDQPLVRLKVSGDFTDMRDEVEYFYNESPSGKEDQWKSIGIVAKHVFALDHFVGCRVGLFVYSTIHPGGNTWFSEFIYPMT